jgi:penicillin amidase
MVLPLCCVVGCGGEVAVQPGGSGPIEQLAVNATIRLPQLPARTDVVFDDLGVAHIYAPDVESAVFVQGYVVASQRFWEMDVFRRVAEGRLSEVFGRISLTTDVAMRTVFTTRDGRRLEEALWEYVQRTDPEVARLAEAYSAGVNAWLADLRAGRNGARLPPEYELPIVIDRRPEDLAEWRPQDIAAIGRLQAWQLSQSMDEEIGRARTLAALPDAVARDVFRSAPAAPATVLPVPSRQRAARVGVAHAVELPPLPLLEAIDEALDAVQASNPLGRRDHGLGSNNWIVSPALSASGHAMLANDPHLQLFNPPIWFMNQIDAGPGNRVNGVIFPGLPGVILGHNEFGAWGATVAVFDVTDVYLESVTTPPDYPQSPRTVLFQGRQVPVLRIEERIEVKNRSPFTAIIEVVPHHGPMVPDPSPGDATVGLAGTNMSFRWTGHEISNDSRFLLDLNRARNVAEFRAAIRHFAVGAQNWVWADVHGDVAYFPRVLIPQRPPGVVPYLPVPGSGEAEWLTDAQGNTLWLPEEKIPQATNPPEGFLATANNDQIGNTLDNDPLNDEIYLTFSADLGFREERIQELLSNRAQVRPAGAKLTADDMSRYQYDTSSKEAARLLPFLFAAAAARPDLVTAEIAEALDRLRRWGDAKPGSAPYDMTSGIDAHACCAPNVRTDVAPRSSPVTAEERADATASSIFAGWTTRLARAVFADDFAGTGIGSPGGQDATKALLHLLEDIERTDPGFRVHTRGVNGESTLWDNRDTAAFETRDEILLSALRDGLTFLSSAFGSAELDNWLWGIIHQVRFQHFVGQAGFDIFDLGPFAAPGGRFTVNPANFSLNADTFTFAGGPSERFVAVLDPAGIRAVNALPGGNNGDPGGMVQERYSTINPELRTTATCWAAGSTVRPSSIAPRPPTSQHTRNARFASPRERSRRLVRRLVRTGSRCVPPRCVAFRRSSRSRVEFEQQFQKDQQEFQQQVGHSWRGPIPAIS